MQIAGEVETLLTHGFADGAMSRWRTLHEVVVVALFIAENENEVARRYLDHLVIDSLRMARMYSGAAPGLGYPPLADQDWQHLQKNAADLISKYGQAFSTDHGWAAGVLHYKKPTFSQIAEAVQFQKYKPYYKMASDNVPAGARGIFASLAPLSNVGDLLLSGPSNAGHEEAGRLTAYSLSQSAVTLMLIEPSLDAIVRAKVLQKLSGEIEEAFIRAKERLDSDERRLTWNSQGTTRKVKRKLVQRQRRV